MAQNTPTRCRNGQGGGRLARPAGGGRHRQGHRQPGLLHGRPVHRAHRGGGARRGSRPRPRSTAAAWSGRRPNAPIKLLPQTQASYLIAIAKNDDARAPAEKDALKEAAAAAGRPAEIEVYQGDHGWTVPDSPVYNEAEAERAWTRLLALYGSAL